MTNQKNQTRLRFLSDFQVYIYGVGGARGEWWRWF